MGAGWGWGRAGWSGALLACALAMAVLSPAAIAAGGLRWSPRRLIDDQFTIGHPIEHVSCPSATFCVATDGDGGILSSTDPTGGRQAWKRVVVKGVQGPISCPTASFCAVANWNGEVVTSTNPSGGAGAWVRAKIDGKTQLEEISCPSVSLCVAGDKNGNVLSSANPTGGAQTWRRVALDPGVELTGLSCAAATFCVATDAGPAGYDNGSSVFVSSNPTGGANAWQTTQLSVSGLGGLSCPTTSFCIGLSGLGDVIASTAPGGGPSAWHTAHVAQGELHSISCASASFCAIAGGSDQATVLTSTDPASANPTWNQAQGVSVSASRGLGDISCAAPSFCAAVDDAGLVVTSKDAAAGEPWGIKQIEGFPTLYAVSCPSASRCYATDGDGNLLSSANPGGGAAPWAATTVAPARLAGASSYGIACPALSLCVATIFQPYGMVAATTGVASTDPGGPASAWTEVMRYVGAQGLFNVSCTSPTLCAALGTDGLWGPLLAVSTHPAKPGSWRIARPHGRAKVFCPAHGRCVDPLGACPTRSLCVDLNGEGPGAAQGPPAGDAPPRLGNGTIKFSTNAAARRPRWRSAKIDPGHILNGVACPAASLCVAVDDGGNVLTATRPAGGARAWRPLHVDGSPLNAISCPSRSFCIAVDAAGHAVIAQPRS